MAALSAFAERDLTPAAQAPAWATARLLTARRTLLAGRLAAARKPLRSTGRRLSARRLEPHTREEF